MLPLLSPAASLTPPSPPLRPNSDYRTLTEQWQQSLHLALYLVYICGTLGLYGACASAAANLGRRPALQVDR